MDLSALVNYIKAEYNMIEADDSVIEDKINIIYRDISKLYTRDTSLEDETLVTVADQEIYVLPSDSRKINEVHITDDKRTRLRSMNANARLWARPSGTPERWFPYGMGEESGNVKQQFGLDPVPGSDEAGLTLTVLYEPMPEELSENSDKPEYVPEEKHYLICWGALGILTGMQEDYNASQYWESRYRNAYNELMVELGVFRESNYPETAKQVGTNGQ